MKKITLLLAILLLSGLAGCQQIPSLLQQSTPLAVSEPVQSVQPSPSFTSSPVPTLFPTKTPRPLSLIVIDSKNANLISKITTWQSETLSLEDFSIIPEKELLVAAGGQTLEFIDLLSFTFQYSYPLEESPLFVAPVAGGHQLVIATASRLILMNLDTSSLEWQIENDQITALACSPDGQKIAAGLKTGEILIVHVADGTFLHTIAAHTKKVTAVLFSPDGQHLLSASEDLTVNMSDPNKGTFERTYWGHGQVVHALAFDPDGTELVTGSDDDKIRYFSTTSAEHVLRSMDFRAEIVSLAYSPAGDLLTVCTVNRSCDILRTSSTKTLISIPFDTPIVKVLVSPDGSLIVTGQKNGRLTAFGVQ